MVIVAHRANRREGAVTAPSERLPDPCSPDVLSVCDGTETVGYIVKRSDGFHVITAAGQALGVFDTAIEGARAIPPRQRGTP